jgi:type IV pilus assembly protein PilV
MKPLPARRRARRRSTAGQRGSFLIEALLGIVIFSIGILGLVSLQVSAMKQSADAGYRSEAALFANELIGTMWAGDRTPLTMQTNYQPGGAGYTAWSARVASLPGVTPSTNMPSVTVDAGTGTVEVVVRWQAPGAEVHQHVIVAQIR